MQKEIGRVDLLGLLDRRERPEVWAKMVKACSKSGVDRTQGFGLEVKLGGSKGDFFWGCSVSGGSVGSEGLL